MDHVTSRRRDLCCESAPLRAVAIATDTPTSVYSQAALPTRAAEVRVNGRRSTIVRRRETSRDLAAGEIIP